MSTIKIKTKEYKQRGVKLKWFQNSTYSLGDEQRAFPFNVSVLDRYNVILEQKIVEVPVEIMETWAKDEIITNYLLSQLGLELDLDNTIDLILEKLITGTITYATGNQEENDNIAKNYVTFIALQIDSYKEGNIEIDDFFEIPGYNVNIVSNETDFTIKEFIKTLLYLSTEEKTEKLNNCVVDIKQ